MFSPTPPNHPAKGRGVSLNPILSAETLRKGRDKTPLGFIYKGIILIHNSQFVGEGGTAVNDAVNSPPSQENSEVNKEVFRVKRKVKKVGEDNELKNVVYALKMRKFMGTGNECPSCRMVGMFGSIARCKTSEGNVFLICGWCGIATPVEEGSW